MKPWIKSHHDDAFRAHPNKHKDPLSIYQLFPEGKKFRIWLPRVSYPIYIEITTNRWAGVDAKTHHDYTFVECKTIIPKVDGLTNVLHKPDVIGYIVASDEGEEGQAKSQKFRFTHSLTDSHEDGWQEITMITTIEDSKSKRHATQVSEILASEPE